MLSEEALKAARTSCTTLHAYYMEQSKNGVTGIPASVPQSYFQSDADLTLTCAFNYLYDLFNLDGLDVSFLRLWTL